MPAPEWYTAFKKRHPPCVPVVLSSLYLLILFLGILSYFYGSLFQVNSRVHNLHILAVDYDGGIIGRAVQRAYTHLQGSNFPTIEFVSPNDFPLSLLVDDGICRRGYWAVLYTQPGASPRLLSTLTGNTTTPYDPGNTITYVFSGVNYPVIGEAYITANLQMLAAAATQTLYNLDGTSLVSLVNTTNPHSLHAFYQPLRARPIELTPAEQGPRVLLNTITIVAPPLMQFFYLMSVDHISLATHTFATHRARPTRLYLLRLLSSKCYTFLSGLVVSVVVYAFREDWALSGVRVVLTWLCFWFYADISYLVMDTVIGNLVPLRFAPFFIFAWVILSVTSTLFPFELNPGFYRWGWALPAHGIWLLLIQVWSRGCVSRLTVALPILVVWWVLGHGTSWWAVRRKCEATGGGSKGE